MFVVRKRIGHVALQLHQAVYRAVNRLQRGARAFSLNGRGSCCRAHSRVAAWRLAAACPQRVAATVLVHGHQQAGGKWGHGVHWFAIKKERLQRASRALAAYLL